MLEVRIIKTPKR